MKLINEVTRVEFNTEELNKGDFIECSDLSWSPEQPVFSPDRIIQVLYHVNRKFYKVSKVTPYEMRVIDSEDTIYCIRPNHAERIGLTKIAGGLPCQ